MFPGIGTVANALAIVVGGLIGLILNKRLKKELSDALIIALGAAIVFIGASGTLAGMLNVSENGSGALETKNVMLLIFSLVGGTLIGSFLGIKQKTERLGAYLKEKSGASGDTRFIDSFVSASLTVCIGAMAVIGSIEDGMSGKPQTLFAKAILDGLIIMVFASITGKGAVFSALPVAAFQGLITLAAVFFAGFIPEQAITNMSFVGSVLVFCVGVNLMFDKKINVADMLPAIFLAIPFTYLPF